MNDSAEYLGDGVYAEFDGHGIRLSTERHDGGRTVEHWIQIDPAVYAELLRYTARLRNMPRASDLHRGEKAGT